MKTKTSLKAGADKKWGDMTSEEQKKLIKDIWDLDKPLEWPQS